MKLKFLALLAAVATMGATGCLVRPYGYYDSGYYGGGYYGGYYAPTYRTYPRYYGRPGGGYYGGYRGGGYGRGWRRY